MSEHQGINNALFQFCMRLDDGPSAAAANDPSRPRASKEDLQWLMECVKSIEPPEKVMQKSLEVLRDAELPDEDRIQVLEQLSDLVEDIDYARDFVVFNGHVQMLVALKRDHENADVRRLHAVTLAQACQHNPKVQDALLQLKFAEHVVPRLRSETVASARAAMLLFCSCMARDYPPGTAAFLEAKGLEALQFLLVSHPEDTKTVTRALFLLEYFASVGVSAVGVIEVAAQLILTHENADVKDRAASLCVELLQRSEKEVRPILLKAIGADIAVIRTAPDASDRMRELAELLAASA